MYAGNVISNTSYMVAAYYRELTTSISYFIEKFTVGYNIEWVDSSAIKCDFFLCLTTNTLKPCTNAMGTRDCSLGEISMVHPYRG